MSYIGTNLVAILAATLAGLIVGAIYAALFRRSGAGQAGEAGVFRPVLIVVAILAEFWFAAILAGALILAPPQADPWIMAIASAVVIWIGFVLPTQVVAGAYHRFSAGTIFGDCLHWLVVMVVQAAVLHAIGLSHP